jgi:broad specificity phosphatase PhoE
VLCVSGAARARPDGRDVSERRGVRAARGFFAKPYQLVWGGETAEEAGGRFEGAVRGVLDERKEGVDTIVAHGTVISLLVARHNDLDASALWRSLGLPSFCVLSAEDLRLREAVPNLKT